MSTTQQAPASTPAATTSVPTEGSSPPQPAAGAGAVTPAVDATTASEILRRAKDEKAKRQSGERIKELEGKTAKLTKVEEARAKKDYWALAEALGEDPQDMFLAFAESVNSREKATTDPRAIARAEAKALLEEERANSLTAAETQARDGYIGATSRALKSGHDKYPMVVRALATEEIARNDLYTIAQDLHEAGKPADPASVLAFVNAHFADLWKPVVAPASTPAAGAPPSSLTSHVPVATGAEDDSDIEANYARARAKFKLG